MVYTDSSSGKALASKLGLKRKSKHVHFRYLFMQDLVASGQLKLSKIPIINKLMPATELFQIWSIFVA